ncbi:MAG: hypothetical protein KDA93_08430 [Planctomycetaceae bacterium]|nr:hypothetical protein [Planctomycetaceae bacterium]
MPTATCDLCDQTAVIHETLTRAGVVKLRHLCRSHGLGLWRSAVDPAIEQAAHAKKKSTYKTVPSNAPVEFRRHRAEH